MNKKIERRCHPLFYSKTFKLIFVQVAMMCFMSMFILIGVSLHVVKLRRIRPDEYKRYFYLNKGDEALFQELRKVEGSMRQISFFKKLWNYDDSNVHDNSTMLNEIVVCGETHKRGINWSKDTIGATKKVIYSILGDNALIKFKKGLVFAINYFNEKDEKNEEIIHQKSNTDINKSNKLLLNLFLASGGYVSPCYMFGRRIYSYVLGKNSGIWGYFTIILPWFFSLFSPQPMMLVHVPRLLVYAAISIYRRIFLHVIISSAEKRVSFFDFSDHIVLYSMYILIISVEWCAACNNIKNRFLLAFIRGYFLSILGIISYSSFFTALYFHFPLETFVGFIVGCVGLFAVFWSFVFFKHIELSKIGL
ncbi:hypothetical protein FG386_001636 [Cryptosporidium ryanae]|uniref:uncharacterized protein n=1 Tax=Cryptosporidium ryanae TaxID=515981 RepID=UPI00351AAAC1|nr:hypothetical protein FG386_001636 [Cryptosporidium ryanae]